MPERITGTDLIYGERLLHAYRTLKSFNLGGVDFDVGPRFFTAPRQSLETGEEALAELLELQRSREPVTEFGEYMRGKIPGTLVYQQAVSGHFFPLSEYANRTLALQARQPTEEEIKAQYEVVVGRFQNLIDAPYNILGWQRFSERYHLDRDDLRKAIFQAQDTFYPIMKDTIRAGYEFQHETIFVSKRDYWLMWSSADQGNFLLQVNEDDINQPLWFKGQEEALTPHEGAHLLQGYKWRRNILNGLISPGYGITTVPGPEEVGCEGLAVTLPYFVPEIWDNMSEFGKFAVERFILNYLVYGKAHWDVNTREPNFDVIKEFIRHHLPMEPEERVNDQLLKRRTSPIHRSYLLAYTEGVRAHMQFARQLSDEARLELVRKEFEQPMLIRQIRDHVRFLSGSRTTVIPAVLPGAIVDMPEGGNNDPKELNDVLSQTSQKQPLNVRLMMILRKWLSLDKGSNAGTLNTPLS